MYRQKIKQQKLLFVGYYNQKFFAPQILQIIHGIPKSPNILKVEPILFWDRAILSQVFYSKAKLSKDIQMINQMSSDQIETQLLQLFDKLFQKQYLEKNIYIFNQMKHNLEIPISLIYKERKIAQVTSNENAILDALKKCSRVTVNQDSKTLKINIPTTKTKLTINPGTKTLEELSTYVNATLFSGYRYQVDKENNVVIYGYDETQIAALKGLLQKELQVSSSIQQSDPFLDLKDSIERAKQQKKTYLGYEPYQQSAMWSAPNAYNYNLYPGFQRPRGAGFIRKAVQSSDEQDNTESNKLKNKIVKEQKGAGIVKQHHKQHQKQHYKQKGNDKDKQCNDKKPKYRQKEGAEGQGCKVYVQKRTRLNSQNFPEIEKQIQKQVLRIKYNKVQIVDIYSRRAPNIAINGDLLKSGIPLLNVEGAFKLEAMKPGGRKESTFDTPKVIIVPRKTSTST